MWSETTVIHPTAWSPTVEQDLARVIAHQHGIEPDDAAIASSLAAARARLGEVHTPVSVTLRGDGTASVELVPGLEEEWQANEDWHVARAAELADQRARDAEAESERLALEQIARDRRRAEIAASGTIEEEG